jgi:hypothetical protein
MFLDPDYTHELFSVSTPTSKNWHEKSSGAPCKLTLSEHESKFRIFIINNITNFLDMSMKDIDYCLLRRDAV